MTARIGELARPTMERLTKLSEGRLITQCAADIVSRPVEWLWAQRIPLGKLTLIAGDPGLGKSMLTANLAAHVSTGKPWPVGEVPCPRGDVLIVSGEDDPEDTIRPRLDAAAADVNHVHILRAVMADYDPASAQVKERGFSLDQDISEIRTYLARHRNTRLVVIDPIAAYLGDTDSNNNADVRGLLAPLSNVAQEFSVTMVVVAHLNKGEGTSAIYRVSGSLGFVAAARAAYVVRKDSSDKDRRLFIPLKNNLAASNTGLAYRIVPVGNGSARIEWEPESFEVGPEDAFVGSARTSGARQDAQKWLLEQLSEPVAAAEVQRRAKLAGIAPATLNRAKTALGIRPERIGSSWVWNLPVAAQEDDQGDHITGP